MNRTLVVGQFSFHKEEPYFVHYSRWSSQTSLSKSCMPYDGSFFSSL